MGVSVMSVCIGVCMGVCGGVCVWTSDCGRMGVSAEVVHGSCGDCWCVWEGVCVSPCGVLVGCSDVCLP